MMYGLPEGVIESLVNVMAMEERIEKTVLFGSRVKGTYSEGSDIDLCLVGNDLDLAALSRLEEHIDDLYFPWTVDLVPAASISDPALVDHIHRVGATIYERGHNT